MLEILPFRYPAVSDGPSAICAFVEIGKRLVEVFRVDFGQYLPEYLAIFELIPCCYAAG